MQLYNTLTRQKELVQPLDDKTIKMYTCGLTVYSQPHIGNWVSYIYWDILQRVLQYEGFSVDRVQNITDVGHLVSDDDDGEDKMEKGARSEGLNAWQVAEKYIAIADDEAYNRLRLLRPRIIRATDCIQEQIDFVINLEQKGYTYEIPEEGIYFDTSKLSHYGELARLDISGLEAGARVAVDGKRNTTDFALWKFSPKDQKRDMEWESPWGKGFPGWHLECSVIAMQGLGEQIDIHTGGIDHIPVHHTNEIAQTESLTGKQFSRYWVHNNHIKVDGTKMSKSLGNIYTLSDIEQRGYDLDAFKLLLLSKHYRTEGNFTWEILDAAQNRLDRWRALSDLVWQLDALAANDTQKKVAEALSDDLDTPQALSKIEAYFDHCEADDRAPERTFLEFLESTLNISLLQPDLNDDDKQILQKRAEARIHKDWKTSDNLRDTLAERNIRVNDKESEQRWYRIRIKIET